jgi:hypothetical protein
VTQVATDTVPIVYGTDFLKLAATGLTMDNIDLEDFGQHFRPRMVFDAAMFIFFAKLESFFYLWLKCNQLSQG